MFQDMFVKTVPGGAKVLLSCPAKGCPIKHQTATVPKHRICTGKGKKRKCRLVEPRTGTVDLTRFVAGKRVKVGAQIIVAVIEKGWIGKQFLFRIVPSHQPTEKIQTLAPGSTKLCPSC